MSNNKEIQESIDITMKDDTNEEESMVNLKPRESLEIESFQDTFAKAWQDETYHDLTLLCSDGVNVTANRFALGARNTIFQKMLYGSFQESTKNEVTVDFPGQVVKAIVEYLHTSQATKFLVGFRSKLPDATDHESLKRCAEEILQLVAAAIFFNMQALCHDVIDVIQKSVEEYPRQAVAILELCIGDIGVSLPKEVKQISLSALFSGNFDLKDAKIVGALPAVVLEEILKYKDSKLDELQLFEILLLWVNNNPNENEDYRKSRAASMMNHIKLELIPTAELDLVVSSSGLVSSNQLLEAFRYQAKESTGSNLQIGKVRSTSIVWKGSKTSDFKYGGGRGEKRHLMDFLDVAPIKRGKYCWTLKLIECRDVTLGVALQPGDLDLTSFCGSDERSWGYDSAGFTSFDDLDEDRFAQYQKASFVTLTLDLKDKYKRGCLSASIDGGESFVLFSGLLDHLQNDATLGFVPAVSIYGCSGQNHIQMHDFKRIL